MRQDQEIQEARAMLEQAERLRAEAGSNPELETALKRCGLMPFYEGVIDFAVTQAAAILARSGAADDGGTPDSALNKSVWYTHYKNWHHSRSRGRVVSVLRRPSHGVLYTILREDDKYNDDVVLGTARELMLADGEADDPFIPVRIQAGHIWRVWHALRSELPPVIQFAEGAYRFDVPESKYLYPVGEAGIGIAETGFSGGVTLWPHLQDVNHVNPLLPERVTFFRGGMISMETLPNSEPEGLFHA